MESFRAQSLVTIIIVLVLQLYFWTGAAEGIHLHHRHGHRHHRHHNQTNPEQTNSTSSEDTTFAYRNINENRTESGETDIDTTPNSNSMERRLENLEQYMTHLCLEDEQDVDRRIRVLGVKCVCPKTEAPVCGSDNVTYYNRCFLHCRAQQALTSYHRYRITLKKFGPC